MRKGIVALIAVALVVAAGAAVWSLSTPLLEEDVDYEVTSLYYQGQEISAQIDTDDVLNLLEDASRSLISRGGLPEYDILNAVEVNLLGGEETLHVVLSGQEGLYAAYQDADWSYSIRDGEALAGALDEILSE